MDRYVLYYIMQYKHDDIMNLEYVNFVYILLSFLLKKYYNNVIMTKTKKQSFHLNLS